MHSQMMRDENCEKDEGQITNERSYFILPRGIEGIS